MASKLNDICSYAKGKTAVVGLTTQNYISTENMLPNKGGITTATNLPSVDQTQAYRKNDVLVSNIRPYFKKIWHAEYDGGCSNDVLVFRAAEGVDPIFLYYVLADDTFFNYATATSKGTKMPRGDKSAIMEYGVPTLDIEAQRKIGALLRSIDQKIAINSKINDNLQQQLEALYRGTIKDSVAECESVTLDQWCHIFTGKKNANQFDEDGQYMFFTCGEKPLRINSYIYDGPAIIISGNGSYTGRTLFYNGRFDLYQRTYACTLKDAIPSEYIFGLYAILKIELHSKIAGGTHGSSIPYIVMNDLAKFEFPFNHTEFADFSEKAKTLLTAIQHNQRQNETLSQIRDALLPKLMSGEIDVANFDF